MCIRDSPNSKSDLFAIFIERCIELAVHRGYAALVTIQNWMFLSSFEPLRKKLISESYISSLVQIGYNSFPELNSKVVQAAASVFVKEKNDNAIGCYVNVNNASQSADKKCEFLSRLMQGDIYKVCTNKFKKVPGRPIAYWASNSVINSFEKNASLSKNLETREGLTTGSNEKFLRFWHELSLEDIGFDIKNGSLARDSGKRYFPYVKGGDFRRWAGNFEYVVNWFNDGEELRSFKDPENGRVRSHNYNGSYGFKKGFTWSSITSGKFSVRNVNTGFMFDAKGPMGFSVNESIQVKHEAFLNSSVANHFMEMLAPTLDFKLGHVLNLPDANISSEKVGCNRNLLVGLSLKDWNSYEIAWDFTDLPLLQNNYQQEKVKSSYFSLRSSWYETTVHMQRLEEENNCLFIEAYALHDELTSVVPLSEITLTCNPHYRYGGNRSEEELETLLQCDTLKELVSYAIGCMMGRYSLDKPGLVLASQGETVRDYLAQIPEPSFAPDDNAIIPLTDQEWFPDDATNRFRDFVRTVWGEEHLQENLDFVAESLCLHAIKTKKGEAALETIRRYLSTQFFKDHLRTYKKRPIYWLFSSGKQKAFECLVYLHRYNESTLAEMRTDYVITLTTKLASYVEKLEQDKDASTSAAEAKAIEKELSKLYKQQAELNTFDEKLRHYADQRISLDLDDGVKVNYGKFGDLLAEVKQVVGK